MKRASRVRVALRRGLVRPEILFLRRLVSDSTLGLDASARHVLRDLCVSNRSIYGDRFYELRVFWHVSYLRSFLFFVRYGWPFSQRLKDSLYTGFDGRTNPEKLKSAYEEAAFHYSIFLMLSMHRGEWLLPFLADTQDNLPKDCSPRILEYGCGVSDMGLILASRGCDVSIADLSDKKLEFAEWRYKVRRLRCTTIPVVNTETIPDIPQAAFDVVIVSEVLEHVRDPLQLLKVLTNALRPRGLLFCTAGGKIERELEGDHLIEAIAIGNSREYMDYFKSNYESLSEKPGMPFLFIRRKQEANLQ